ncbi:MAG: FAD-dependent oxidoreductase [Geminicoccaceae bacterium]
MVSKSRRLGLGFGYLLDRDRPRRFRVDRKTIRALEGDTVASALVANGLTIGGRSPRFSRVRASNRFSGFGRGTIVRRDGSLVDPMEEAAREGLQLLRRAERPDSSWFDRVRTYLLRDADHTGDLERFAAWSRQGFEAREPGIRARRGGASLPEARALPDAERIHHHVDLAVVGAGFAGLLAALAASRAGLQVLVVDERNEIGGGLLYGRFGGAQRNADALRQLLFQAVNQRRSIVQLCGARVFWADPTKRLLAAQGQRTHDIHFDQMILATGARDQVPLFVHNDLPGIVGADDAQRLMRLYGLQPGKRVVIQAVDDRGYELALDLLEANVAVAAVVDMRSRYDLTQAIETIRVSGTRLIAGATIVRADGTNRVRSATIVQASDAKGRRRRFKINCDTIISACRQLPDAALAGHLGARLVFDARQGRFVIDRSELPSWAHLVGAVGDAIDLKATLQSVLSAIQTITSKQADLDEALIAGGDLVAEGPSIIPSTPLPPRNSKAFVDLQAEITLGDVIAMTEKETLDLVDTFAALGLSEVAGADQRTWAELAVAMAQPSSAGRFEIDTSTTPARPVAFSALASFQPQPVRRLPLEAVHQNAGARFKRMGRWLGVEQFNERDRGPALIREDCLVADLSARLWIDCCGPDAARFLDRVSASRHGDQQVGTRVPGLFCGERGMTIAVGAVERWGGDHFVIEAEPELESRLLAWLERWARKLGHRCDLIDISASIATFLIGGKDAAGLASRLGFDANDLNRPKQERKIFKSRSTAWPVSARNGEWLGAGPLLITGEAGISRQIWATLLKTDEVHKPRNVGLAMVRASRLAGGQIRDVPLDELEVDPFELGLGDLVALDKAAFVGRDALIPLSKKPAARRTVIVRPKDSRHTLGRLASSVTDDRKVVGELIAAQHLDDGAAIGLVLVDGALDLRAARLRIDTGDDAATVVSVWNLDGNQVGRQRAARSAHA